MITILPLAYYINLVTGSFQPLLLVTLATCFMSHNVVSCINFFIKEHDDDDD